MEARFDKQVLERYQRIMTLLEERCQSVLSTLDLDEVSHLIHHPRKEIRQFGGRVISGHSLPVDSFPSNLLFELLLVQDKDLQKVRDIVFAKLTIVGRQNHRDLWLKLMVHSVDSLRQIGSDNLKAVLDYDKTYHLDILKRMFAFCNPKPVGQLFVGDQKAIFERVVHETPTDTIVKECELLESAYFSAHPEMFNLLRAHAKECYSNFEDDGVRDLGSIAAKQTEGTISTAHTEDLPEITKLIEVHIAQTQPDDLRDEDWWVPRLLSPNAMVQTILGVLLGTYAKGEPRRASEIAGDILDSMALQVTTFQTEQQSQSVVPSYDELIGHVALQSFCTDFPDRGIKFVHFWIRMFMHLHPAVRTYGETKLLELLAADPSDLSFKSVLNALVRLLRRDEVFDKAYDSVIKFCSQNIPKKMYLVRSSFVKKSFRL